MLEKSAGKNIFTKRLYVVNFEERYISCQQFRIAEFVFEQIWQECNFQAGSTFKCYKWTTIDSKIQKPPVEVDIEDGKETLKEKISLERNTISRFRTNNIESTMR